METEKPKLLVQVRAVARARHLSHKTEGVYHNFIKRFILVYNKKHPKDLETEEITSFLTHLAVNARFNPRRAQPFNLHQRKNLEKHAIVASG